MTDQERGRRWTLDGWHTSVQAVTSLGTGETRCMARGLVCAAEVVAELGLPVTKGGCNHVQFGQDRRALSPQGKDGLLLGAPQCSIVG